MCKFYYGSNFIIALIFFLIPSPSYSSNFTNNSTSKNTYGVSGIIEMPVANPSSDGELSFTSSQFGSNIRNSISFQALPRVNFVFRHSGLGDKNFDYIKSGYTYWDRSFDLRLNIKKQTDFFPNITVGLQDIIGTGLFASEYLVASKNIFNAFNLTTGLGWGRLATNNVIGSTGKRPYQSHALGGRLRYKDMFQGDVGLFGGIEYKPIDNNLKLNIEYSSDSYTNDSDYNLQMPTSQINFGIDYKLSDSINLSSYYAQGKELGLQFNFYAIPEKTSSGKIIEDIPEPFYSIPFPSKKNYRKIWTNVVDELKKQKIDVISYGVIENTSTIVISNNKFISQVQSIGRTLRILSKHIPSNISEFRVINAIAGIPVIEVSIDRNKLASIIDAPNSELLSLEIVKIKSVPKQIYDLEENQKILNEFDWSITPYYKLHLFDPDKPLYYDTGLKLFTSYNFKPWLNIHATIDEPLYSNFDEIYRGVKGQLPHVRTELKNYLNVTDTKIRDLSLNSFYKLSNNIYGKTSVGYLEFMYAGISSELLYRPIKSNIATGIELNYVKPRDYRQLFKLRNIPEMSNLHGHLSTYWDTNYYNYVGQLDIGKYLAGDQGGTLTLTRKFLNGWEVGGFFSLTDASFEEFGEGSFDKGFFFTVPFNSLVPIDTRYKLTETVRPIQGDGGARVNIPNRLYKIIGEHSSNRYKRSWNSVWR